MGVRPALERALGALRLEVQRGVHLDHRAHVIAGASAPARGEGARAGELAAAVGVVRNEIVARPTPHVAHEGDLVVAALLAGEVGERVLEAKRNEIGWDLL